MSPTVEYYKNLLDKLFDGIVCVDREKKITFWNKSAENISGYAFNDAVGSLVCSEIATHCPDMESDGCGDNCPIESTLKDGRTREAELFLLHHEGNRIPIACRIEPIHDADGKISGVVQIFHDNSSRIAARNVIEKLRKLALIDPLTGLANRRYLDKVIESKTDEMKRYDLDFGLMFIDIDHFKRVNDRYGHEVGDKVLWSVAQNLSTVIRLSDIVGRWGGEEFVAVVLNLGMGELEVVAEKMRKTIEGLEIACNGDSVQVTISIGATLASSGEDMDKRAILKKADELMYASKNKGRNQVTIG
ncbi:MAG: sensor domain-containing diguanylate cyclase [Candidatus Glassbacteria bacterium]|nr:sensor domain-containing diguanylate cyclase [Candidatus Glassbacteria bacterium]